MTPPKLRPLRPKQPFVVGALVALAIGAGATPGAVVLAQAPTAEQAAERALDGRWSGQLTHPQMRLDGRAPEPLTLDIRACAGAAGRLCGRMVGANGACGAVALELDAAPQQDGLPETTHYRGRLSLPGLQPIAVSASIVRRPDAEAAARKPRLVITEGVASPFARRIPAMLSVGLEREGPSSCEPRATS